jgi:hypothetical protein
VVEVEADLEAAVRRRRSRRPRLASSGHHHCPRHVPFIIDFDRPVALIANTGLGAEHENYDQASNRTARFAERVLFCRWAAKRS